MEQEKLESLEAPRTQDSRPSYLAEAGDGFLARVPEGKLEDWRRAQELPAAPLNRAEQLLRDRIVQRIYGERK